MQKHVVTVQVDVYAEDPESVDELVKIGMTATPFAGWRVVSEDLRYIENIFGRGIGQ